MGAGPGRPDLLTLRGAEVLARADAVLLDALVDRRILRHARPGVRVVEAGKRGHGHVFMRQPTINKLLVTLARQGKTVVRLKGGDPYLFGRGGEEADWLHSHKIPFEVVPGVSSVTAVPAYAGIPLTHRGITSTVTVVTGHSGFENPYLRETRRERAWTRGPGVDWSKLDPQNSLVVLMGVARLPVIVDNLKTAGWPLSTPAAVVQSGTLPNQRVVEGTLGTIVEKTAAAKLGPPGVIVFGAVVSMRRTLNWFESLPLFGKTVMVTRASDASSRLSRELESRGAAVVEAPVVKIQPLPLSGRGKEKLRRLKSYDGILLTSANAVKILGALRKKAPWPPGPRAYAVGPKTAEAMREAGISVHGMAQEFRAEGLAKIVGKVRGMTFLFPRAEGGRDVLIGDLTRRGARVDLLPLYRTVPRPLPAEARKALREGTIDAVAFASGSAVDALLSAFAPAERRKIFSKTLALSIGPITSDVLRAKGITRICQAREATLEGMAESLETWGKT